MKNRRNEDFYYWCCEWCDSENRVRWEDVGEELFCGACHKQAQLEPESEIQLEAA